MIENVKADYNHLYPYCCGGGDVAPDATGSPCICCPPSPCGGGCCCC